MPAQPDLGTRRIPLQFEVPDVPAFHPFLSSAERYPRNAAFVYQGTLLTYEEWEKLSRRFAASLSGWIKKGDRIAIYMRNCPQFGIAYMGILMAGGILVTCNPLLTTHELDYQLRDSCAEAIVTTEDLLPKVKMCQSFASLKGIIVAQPHKECSSLLTTRKLTAISKERGILPFRVMLAGGGEDFEPVEIIPRKDIAHIMYTGGTAGVPKGVIHTHHNVVTATLSHIITAAGVKPEMDKKGYLFIDNDPADLTAHWEFPLRIGRERALIVAPWSHVGGLIVWFHQPIALALKMFLMDRFDAQELLRRLEEWDITWAGGSPTVISYLVNHPNFQTTDISSIRLWNSGGSSLPEEHCQRLKERIQGVVVEGYGLTESVGAAFRNPANRSGKRKIGSVGIVFPNVEAKVIDERGEEVPYGQVGELILKGFQISPGYFNQPDETKSTFRQGWLFTGDLAKMDEEGYVSIVDRKKEMIIYKSYNVSPRELEEIICQHPSVKMCAVLGKKDMNTGEIPVAFVSCKTKQANPEDIKLFVNERVAPYKKVREIHLMEELPLSGPGKILKRELRKYLDS